MIPPAKWEVFQSPTRQSLLRFAGWCLLIVMLTAGHSPAAPPKTVRPADARAMKALMEKLRPLHTPLGEPQEGDWLIDHPEPGQTFRQYLQGRPVTARGQRRVLYVQPLGEFTDAQRDVVKLTADFMGRYFQLPVKIQSDLPLSLVPADARRTHPAWNNDQILSTYVLDKLLPPRLPPDGAACIAFTASDLWPGKGWNFVFGQASLANRVGVWSIYRNGDPHEDETAFRLCLLRTMKTAVHETGHMFGIKHCTRYECVMCGSNHREEADRKPLEVCPECVAKVCWATGADPRVRFDELATFCKDHGLEAEREFYETSANALMK